MNPKFVTAVKGDRKRAVILLI